jgi:hypothetical protein
VCFGVALTPENWGVRRAQPTLTINAKTIVALVTMSRSVRAHWGASSWAAQLLAGNAISITIEPCQAALVEVEHGFATRDHLATDALGSA